MSETREDTGLLKQIAGGLFFSRKVFASIKKKPSLLSAALIILAMAVIAAWAGYNYGGKMPIPSEVTEMVFPMGGGPEQFRQIFGVVGALGGLMSVIISWVLISALFHGFSRAFKGKGSFKTMLALAAFASLPILIQQLLRLVDSLTITEAKVALLMAPLQVSSNAFLNALANNAIQTFTVFGIWSAILFVIAVGLNYDLTTSKSTILVVVVYLLLIVLPVLSSLFLGPFTASPTMSLSPPHPV